MWPKGLRKKAVKKGCAFAVIWEVIWSEIRKAWSSFWSKSCDFGGDLDAKRPGFDNFWVKKSWFGWSFGPIYGVCLVKKLWFGSFGWSFGVIYVRSGGLFRQKDVFWMIGVVIWSDICTAWASFWAKSCDLSHLDGHLELYMYGLGVFLRHLGEVRRPRRRLRPCAAGAAEGVFFGCTKAS